MKATAREVPAGPLLVGKRIWPLTLRGDEAREDDGSIWRCHALNGATVLVYAPMKATTEDVEAFLASSPVIEIERENN